MSIPQIPTTTQILTFAEKLTAFLAEHHAKAKNASPVPRIRLEYGLRYVRIVRCEYEDQGSAYGFVDRLNGDLLKADGWKKRAKHARGNIFNENPLVGCGPYGLAYLR